MKKIFCILLMCICLSVPMVAHAEPTVFIDGEVAQEGSGGIIDLSRYVDDVTKWAVGFVTNYNWSTGVDVVGYIYDNLTSIKLSSNGDDSYSVDNSTYDEINKLLTRGGFNGYLFIGAFGGSSDAPYYSNFTISPIYVTRSFNGSRYTYNGTAGAPYAYNGVPSNLGLSNAVTQNFVQYSGSNPLSPNPSINSGNVSCGTGSISGHVVTLSNCWCSAIVAENGNTLGNNTISSQAFTPMTPTQISNIDYETWYDNKYDNSITVNNAYNYYNTIVAPEPQEIPTQAPYDPSLVYTDINTNLFNYSEGVIGLPVSVDMLGMGFITATYLSLPSSIQNLILLTLTLALACIVTGVASFVFHKV